MATAAVASRRAGSDDPAPHETIPEDVLGQVAHYVGAVEATERELRDALVLVAERHERNHELSCGATTLAIWSTDHLCWLRRLAATYGTEPDAHAERLRSALRDGPRLGVVGELADAWDLAALVQHAEILWTVIVQGARELHDDTLLDVASRARDHSRRQLAWLRTIVKTGARDAVAIVPDQLGQVAATG